MRSVTLIIAAREKDQAGMICMRGINFIIVKVKYQDAVISCFFWMSKLTECFFLRNRVEREKKLPSIPYSFRY